MGPASADKALRQSDRCDDLTLPSRQHETIARPTALHRSLLQAQLKEATKDEVLDVDFDIIQKDLYKQVHPNALAERVQKRFGSQIEAANVTAHRELPRAAATTWRWPAHKSDTQTLEEIAPGVHEAAVAMPIWASHPLGIPSSCFDPAYHHHRLLSHVTERSGAGSAPPVNLVATASARTLKHGRSATVPRAAAIAEATEAATEAQRETKGQPQHEGDNDLNGLTHHGCSEPPRSPPSPRTPLPLDSVMMKAVPVQMIDASVRPRRKVTESAGKPTKDSKAAIAPQLSPTPPQPQPPAPPPSKLAISPRSAPVTPTPKRSPSQQQRQQSCRIGNGMSASQLSLESTYDFDERELESFSRPRRMAARLCAHPDFELGVVLLILANTITLALYRP
ncbi:hypothetical protein Vafri_10595, partial [Volvox africanus]